MSGALAASSRSCAAGLAAALLLAAAPARALEPRFDHRDQMGLALEVAFSRVTATTSGGLSRSVYDLGSLRLAWSFDVTGEGDEILLGGAWSRRPRWGIPPGSRTHATEGSSARRELKTFFDAGLVAAVAPWFAVGPRVGFDVMYDFSREFGVFASLGAATAFGQFRGFSVGIGAGFQRRWPA
jgi:hypothetical protein